MASTTGHKEIRIKVNVYVDSGVAPLVEALNLFPNIETLDSCEGTTENGAFVYFRCCGNSFEPRARETVDFVFQLSLALRSHPNPSTDYRLRLEWMASDEPMAEIVTQHDNIGALAEKISLFAASLTNHKNLSACGTERIEPHN